jgi:hypothetical protein
VETALPRILALIGCRLPRTMQMYLPAKERTMNRVLVDDAVRSKLDECRTTTEICDKEGRILGVFTPAADLDRRWYEWAKGQYSEEELNRIANEPGEMTTAEVLKSLQP